MCRTNSSYYFNVSNFLRKKDHIQCNIASYPIIVHLISFFSAGLKLTGICSPYLNYCVPVSCVPTPPRYRYEEPLSLRQVNCWFPVSLLALFYKEIASILRQICDQYKRLFSLLHRTKKCTRLYKAQHQNRKIKLRSKECHQWWSLDGQPIEKDSSWFEMRFEKFHSTVDRFDGSQLCRKVKTICQTSGGWQC